ncbi:hypothetical protein KCP76_22575 [Salmonella enterica subsp. enterica serovar Weltevreden]|nr:hypothetical protein KCP76_22575 [Salmonella enterica subsp. enterica serovar Weltevreden]
MEVPMILHPSLASRRSLRYAEALTALHDVPLGSHHLDIRRYQFHQQYYLRYENHSGVAQYLAIPLSFHLMVYAATLVTTACSYPPGWIFIRAGVQNPPEILADI